MIANAKAKRRPFAPVDQSGRAHVGFYEDALTSRRIELADPNGLRYFAPCNVDATTAVNGAIWALVNTSSNTKNIYIRQLLLGMHYEATAAAAHVTFTLRRTTTTSGAALSGGTNVTPIKRASSQAASMIAAADCEVALAGGTAVTIGGSGQTNYQVADLRLTVGVSSTTAIFPIVFAPAFHGYNELVIEPGQIFSIINSNAKVTISGFIEWEERL